MSEKKRKTFYWIIKVLSLVVSCGFPIYAIWEHFPVLTVHSISAGGIISLVVIAIIFRSAVFNFIKDKMKLQHAPPLAVWLILIIVSYILQYIARFLQIISRVFWMGLVGCAIGTVLTYIAENHCVKKEGEDNGS